MMASKVQGDFDKAHLYAITEAEREDIEAYRAQVRTQVGAKTSEQETAAARMQARIRGTQVRGPGTMSHPTRFTCHLSALRFASKKRNTKCRPQQSWYKSPTVAIQNGIARRSSGASLGWGTCF